MVFHSLANCHLVLISLDKRDWMTSARTSITGGSGGSGSLAGTCFALVVVTESPVGRTTPTLVGSLADVVDVHMHRLVPRLRAGIDLALHLDLHQSAGDIPAYDGVGDNAACVAGMRCPACP